jgi:hypothetical protein
VRDSMLPVCLYFVMFVVVPRFSLLRLKMLNSRMPILTSLLIRRTTSLSDFWVL